MKQIIKQDYYKDVCYKIWEDEDGDFSYTYTFPFTNVSNISDTFITMEDAIEDCINSIDSDVAKFNKS